MARPVQHPTVLGLPVPVSLNTNASHVLGDSLCMSLSALRLMLHSQHTSVRLIPGPSAATRNPTPPLHHAVTPPTCAATPASPSSLCLAARPPPTPPAGSARRPLAALPVCSAPLGEGLGLPLKEERGRKMLNISCSLPHRMVATIVCASWVGYSGPRKSATYLPFPRSTSGTGPLPTPKWWRASRLAARIAAHAAHTSAC